MVFGACLLGMALVEFYIFVALLLLAIVGLAGWSNERDKRERLQTAAKDLEHIYALAAEALQEHSPQKLNAVNELIESWDRNYSAEVGEPIAKLDPKLA